MTPAGITRYARRVLGSTAQPAAVAGSRFTARFESRRHVHRLHPARLLRVVAGLGLFTFGMINAFIPGPGGSLFIFASAFVLSGESRLFAAMLDRGELRFQRQVEWMLAHKVLVATAISGTILLVTVLVGAVLAR